VIFEKAEEAAEIREEAIAEGDWTKADEQ